MCATANDCGPASRPPMSRSTPADTTRRRVVGQCRADSEDPMEPTMTVQLIALAFDAFAPGELGRFWAHALGWDVRETDGVVELVPTDVTSFSLLLRPAAEEKVGQNRIHFDLTTS